RDNFVTERNNWECPHRPCGYAARGDSVRREQIVPLLRRGRRRLLGGGGTPRARTVGFRRGSRNARGCWGRRCVREGARRCGLGWRRHDRRWERARHGGNRGSDLALRIRRARAEVARCKTEQREEREPER